MEQTEDQKWADYQLIIKNYFNQENVRNQIATAVNEGKTTVNIDLNDLRNKHAPLAKEIIQNPEKAIKLLSVELQQEVQTLYQDEADQDQKKITQVPTFTVGFTGDMGRNLVTPRGLLSKLSNQLVGVQGLVTRLSTVKSKLIKSVHYCSNTDKGHVKEYDNVYDLTKAHNSKTSRTIPIKDQDSNPMTMEYGPSTFINTQTFSLQELPETAPPGLLPRAINVVLENDLVDTIKPGDRIQVTGVYKSVANGKSQNTGILKTILVATNVEVLTTEVGSIELSADDIRRIKDQAKKPNLVEKMVNSIAPSIHGHDNIKAGILLQLLGGVEKNIDGFHLRGDINIMMIGDPSTAKSQMLRYVMNMAPLAINTTGRGSSGVGLTACVKIDRETGARTLEAGAMVLADRGIVCIDELDKMDEVDRVAIHEAMEQQTVTISKAGIHCSLNARCSVIAAANPIYGEYHTDIPPTKNINLPDSLLSRFDLLFIVLDEKDQEKDRKVAERVTKNHRYKGLGQDKITQTREMIDEDEQDYVIQPQIIEKLGKEGEIFQRLNLYSDKNQIYTPEFIQKYIKFAKKSVEPVLTEEAVQYLGRKWTNLRQKDQQNTDIKVLPITVRTYETLIRLSTAFAKLKLSKKITTEHCKFAHDLLKKSLFDADDDEDSDDSDGGENGMEQEKGKKFKSKQQTKKSFQRVKRQDNKKTQEEMDEEFNVSKAKLTQLPATTTRQTRQSQQQQQTTKSKKSDKKTQQISQQMKAINLDDNDEKEAQDKLNEIAISSIKISKQERVLVFKELGKMLDNTGVDSCTLEEVWKRIEPVFGKGNQDKLRKALLELDENQKIDYNDAENTISLI